MPFKALNTSQTHVYAVCHNSHLVTQVAHVQSLYKFIFYLITVIYSMFFN